MKMPQEIINQFEDYAYRQYEASRVAVALSSRSPVDDKMAREEFCRKDDKGNYVHHAPGLMWVGWKLCLDANHDYLQMSHLWLQWVEMQERVAAELPKDYIITLELDGIVNGLEGSGLMAVCLRNPDGDYIVDFDDPEDMDSPGVFIRIVDAALTHAKRKGLN